ncbi:MAG: kinase [Polymorphobacter sp.]|uniref:kinase n=1 Tax=Polymorphobacter sp. TaxID=1909290 RepID=UPI003A88218D
MAEHHPRASAAHGSSPPRNIVDTHIAAPGPKEAPITTPPDTPPARLPARLAAWVEAQVAAAARPPLLMVSGAQGLGKSTAIAALAAHPQLRIATLSLDDVYLTQAARQRLAASIHPLCATRGPPGTHDLALLADTLDALASGHETAIPRFDKRLDDRAPKAEWPRAPAAPHAIVIEGWLMGVRPAPAPEPAPINALEAEEDPDGQWRGWQEAALQSGYAQLWDRADAFLHLDAPGFEVVPRWRLEQEATLLGTTPARLPPARRAWVARFVQHYERLTRRMLAGHRRPGAVIRLGPNRQLLADGPAQG